VAPFITTSLLWLSSNLRKDEKKNEANQPYWTPDYFLTRNPS
jgi:hypothetical protein